MRSIWYIEILSFFGSLLAGGFFLLCLVVLGLLNYEYLNLFLGLLVMIFVSILSFIPQKDQKVSFRPVIFSFLNQGFVLFLFGVYEVFKPTDISFLWTILSFQTLFFFFVSNPIQRFLSPILFFVFSVVLLFEYKILILVPILTAVSVALFYRFTQPENIPENFESLPYSLCISLLCLAGFSFFPELKQSPKIPQLQTVVFYLAGCFFLYQELIPQTNYRILTTLLLFFGLIFFPTLETPGVIASFLVILVSFAKGYPFLTYLAWASLVLFYFGFYYDLDSTLLEKSQMMFGSSLLFFLSYFGLRFSPFRKKR
ncbi:DUF4401 domain-containing protein [Leptospira perdikensis]|uniref:DUF4401 domain-containing protein n=1 Tax=Leptospira perdikensis TaxID=2484948 RepID=A0A4R9JK79_9LEPT|nr:DUF4401 domain-containing protein [Leptospira perdikensis]TGL45889.1 DUF4401 domain-containing protein [Leptospira perdikensis]